MRTIGEIIKNILRRFFDYEVFNAVTRFMTVYVLVMSFYFLYKGAFNNEIAVKALQFYIITALSLEVIAFVRRFIRGCIEWKRAGLSFSLKLDADEDDDFEGE